MAIESNKLSINKQQSDLQADKTLISRIKNELDSIGGLSKFISPKDTIIIKPNFNTADPYPGSTDPVFLLSMIELLKSHTSPSNVTLAESSVFHATTNKIMRNVFQDSFDAIDIPIITEKDFNYKSVDLKQYGATYIKKVKFPTQITEREAKLVLLPCLKTHFIAEYTGALKLAVGFMERTQKMRLHMSRKVPEKVAEINLGYKPDLVIMDARKIFVTGGPQKGDIEIPDTIIAGHSRTQVDMDGVDLIKKFSLDNTKNKIQQYQSSTEVRSIKRALSLNIE